MFKDEEEGKPIVDEEEFKVIAEHFKRETGKPWTHEEAKQIYEHCERLFFNLSLFDMAYAGYVIMSWDAKNNEVLYRGTDIAFETAKKFQENSDKNALDDLMGSIGENGELEN